MNFAGLEKRAHTMKTLVNDNVDLCMRVQQLEIVLAGYKARGFWPRLIELVKSWKGDANELSLHD